jgi:hypothetical protein
VGDGTKSALARGDCKMCYYITATVPAECNLEVLRQVIEKHGFGFTSLTNSSITAQLPKGSQYYRATGSYCDCDDGFGYSFHYDRPSNQNDLTKYANKLRKKGWSEAKIHRSLQERTLAHEKPRPGIPESADRWIKFFREIPLEKQTPKIGLITHFYQGDIETEDFHIKSTQILVLADLRQETILGLEDDVLYTFTG